MSNMFCMNKLFNDETCDPRSPTALSERLPQIGTEVRSEGEGEGLSRIESAA